MAEIQNTVLKASSVGSLGGDSQLISYDDMLKSGMHFGRKKTVFHPGMGPYVFTVRDGICIIDLLKTQIYIRQTIEALRKVVDSGGIILFVALTKQSTESVKELAIELGMPYVVDRWLGGTLTNYKILNSRVKRLEEMERQVVSGELDKYVKKERTMFNKELAKMKVKFDGLKKLTRLPDFVFVSSLKESMLPVREAQKMGIRVAAITNTDSDPRLANCLIPANDRSKKSVDLIVHSIKSELAKK
jgi:small subunit ribosomal protein S2